MTTTEPPIEADDPSASGSPMLDLLSGFIIELRNAGLPVSLTENLDAMEAVKHIPMEDRETFKYALAATLVKNHSHWKAFEVVFEVFFALRGSEYEIDEDRFSELEDMDDDEQGEAQGQGESQGQGGGGGEALSPEQLAQMLLDALRKGDQAMMLSLIHI